MEETLLFGSFLAFILLLVIVLTNAHMIPIVIDSIGLSGAFSGGCMIFSSLLALCSVIWALRFRFSRRQFALLAKYLLLFCGGFSVLFVGYFLFFFDLIFEVWLFIPAFSVKFVIAVTLLLYVSTVFVLLKKIFGERVSRWLCIKGVSDTAYLDQAFSLLARAERELHRRNYEGASQYFHSAATIYANLERWRDSAENYLRAADALSMEKDMAFGAAYTYGFAAAASIINKNVEKANQAIERGREILEREKMDSESVQKASAILSLLTTICNGDLKNAEEQWKFLERKIKQWMYANPQEAYLLFEKASHVRIKEIG